MSEWNPRYLAYCRAHRKSPARMMDHDRRRFPGGVMAGFVFWIGAKWTAWAKTKGIANHQTHPKSEADHASFDLFLESNP